MLAPGSHSFSSIRLNCEFRSCRGHNAVRIYLCFQSQTNPSVIIFVIDQDIPPQRRLNVIHLHCPSSARWYCHSHNHFYPLYLSCLASPVLFTSPLSLFLYIHLLGQSSLHPVLFLL